MKLDLKLLIATAIAGLVGFLVNQILYTVLVDAMPRPILIAVLVAVLMLICCITICAVVMITDTTSDDFLFLSGRSVIIIGLVVCLVVLFLLAMLFEWIYDHREVTTAGASSYVFVLDESGSMSSNDPDLLRYSAVDDVVNSVVGDVPYAVYMFSDNCVRIRDMAPASGGSLVRPAEADQTMMGGTGISNALTVVYDDLQNGQLAGGDHPHVILLTDGYASDMSWLFGKDILKSYKKDEIMVSTVGLGIVDEDLLSEIAEKTGGQFVLVQDATQLAQGFTNAASLKADRDMISQRNVAENNGLYLFLRILFLTLIGAIAAFMKAMASADYDGTILILVEGCIAALITALIMEFGLAIGLPVFLCRLLYWMALAVTPRTITERIVRGGPERMVVTSENYVNPFANASNSGNDGDSAGNADDGSVGFSGFGGSSDYSGSINGFGSSSDNSGGGSTGFGGSSGGYGGSSGGFGGRKW